MRITNLLTPGVATLRFGHSAHGVSQSRVSMDMGDSLYGAEDRSGSIGDMEETVDFVEPVEDSRRR